MAGTASDAFKNAQAQAAVNQGAIVSLHSANPPTDANELSTAGGVYARKTTVWGTPAVPGSGTDSGKSVCTGSTQTMNVPVNSTASAYAIRSSGSGTPILFGDALTATVITNATGPVPVEVTPVYKYAHQ